MDCFRPLGILGYNLQAISTICFAGLCWPSKSKEVMHCFSLLGDGKLPGSPCALGCMGSFRYGSDLHGQLIDRARGCKEVHAAHFLIVLEGILIFVALQEFQN